MLIKHPQSQGGEIVKQESLLPYKFVCLFVF